MSCTSMMLLPAESVVLMPEDLRRNLISTKLGAIVFAGTLKKFWISLHMIGVDPVTSGRVILTSGLIELEISKLIRRCEINKILFSLI